MEKQRENLPEWVAKPENAKRSVQGKKRKKRRRYLIMIFFYSTALEVGLWLGTRSGEGQHREEELGQVSQWKITPGRAGLCW